MKKLIILLLFIPLVSLGQTQIINGIELNGRQGMVKVGDLSWEIMIAHCQLFQLVSNFILKNRKKILPNKEIDI